MNTAQVPQKVNEDSVNRLQANIENYPPVEREKIFDKIKAKSKVFLIEEGSKAEITDAILKKPFEKVN